MKRIVICADGTWNEPDQIDDVTKKRKPTNVLKAARLVLGQAKDQTSQVVYYHTGVGTHPGVDKYTGGAFGDGMCANVRDLYRFIIYNYFPGDELYFFGFSRGAFTVRTLAGFMNKFGLLHKGDDFYTSDVYGLYEKSLGPESDEWQQIFKHVKEPHPCPPIRFVGVWDTVGSLGPPGAIGQLFNKGKYKFHDIELNLNIENAYHALAIDEHRKPFAPSIWTRPAGWKGKLEQAWFVGVHCNVGGGYHPDGVANEALQWLMEKAEGVGLQFDAPNAARYTPCFNTDLRESMSTMYKLMGSYLRPIGQHLADGEVVHQSAIDRWKLLPGYRPPNLAAYLNQAGNPPFAQTLRIPRGKPCAPMSQP
jgi:uncharacterized protein (DUF2235 family)